MDLIFSGMDMGDIFGDIFGDFFGGGRSNARRNGPAKGANIRLSIRISFEEAVFGCTKELEFNYKETCSPHVMVMEQSRELHRKLVHSVRDPVRSYVSVSLFLALYRMFHMSIMWWFWKSSKKKNVLFVMELVIIQRK